MNSRQRAFCEFYVNCGSAAEAARRAGYSAKTARTQGSALLTKAEIQQKIRTLQDTDSKQRIADAQEIRAFWTATMLDETERTADRLKASELLARSQGAFLPALEDSDGKSDVDVVIYLPKVQSESECSVMED